MDYSEVSRYVTLVFLLVSLVGFGGWVAPFVSSPNPGGNDYTVEHVYIRADDRITTASLYLPDGNDRVPGVVFGAGSGTSPRIYTNYGAALATNGFAVLIPGKTSGLDPRKPIQWEIRRETPVVLNLAKENYLNWVSYLASHPRVDENRLVIGGHSGGANSAYRVAYERPDVNGIVAVAGRFPPERDETIRTNLLLATGSEDGLVPPSKIVEVSKVLTGTTVHPGEQIGTFENGTAVRVVVADGASHLSEADNRQLIRETTDWALRSVGESPPEELGIRVRSLGSVGYQALFGLVGVLGITAVAKRVGTHRLGDGPRQETVVALVWLVGMILVLHSTLSQRIYYLGPMAAQFSKYALLSVILLGTGVLLDRLASVTAWTETRGGSSLLDVIFMFLPPGAFVLTSTRFVTFQLVTTTVLSSAVLVVLSVFLAELAMLNIRRRVRWAVVGLVVLWVVPAIVPPYL
jgi:dienelactone hydrolase